MIRHPIVTRARYERYGYIFHPDYDGVFSDVEFEEVARRDGVIVEARHIMFMHKHKCLMPHLAIDEQYVRMNSNHAYRYGNNVFKRRKAAGFPK